MNSSKSVATICALLGFVALYLVLNNPAQAPENVTPSSASWKSALLSASSDKCMSYSKKDSCNSDADCIWCVSYAIPSACYSLDDAKNLPSPVFQCNRDASAGSGDEDPIVVAIPPKDAEMPKKASSTYTTTEPLTRAEITVTEHNEDGLCDPNVQQYSGYFTLPNTKKHYFFWFFESRSKPESDPLVLWLTGGPGCSSEVALFGENGPCSIEGTETKLNPYSWNSKANLLYVDQPSGTGFSYGDETTHNEKGVSDALYSFLIEFLRKYPKYQKVPFNIFGESYAGHYVPASAHRIWRGNKDGESDIHINLKGVSVGNGMSNPFIQMPFYPQMAYRSETTPQVVSHAQYLEMERDVPVCQVLIKVCLAVGGFTCDYALAFCESSLISPMQVNGWNQYDARIKCAKPPLCYDFSRVGDYLNRDDIREKLGVPKHVKRWEECNFGVNAMFHADWIHNFDICLPDLLNDDIPVLIYAGDCDYICNWLGNKAWTLELKWKGTDGFNMAQDVDWNNGAGKLRKYKSFSFLQVHKAGHMVPMDKPKEAVEMLNTFIFNQAPFDKDSHTTEEVENKPSAEDMVILPSDVGVA